MAAFQEAMRGLEDGIDGLIKSAEGVPAHIIQDVLQRRANQQRVLAEASAQEGAGQAIKNDPVNQRESAARAAPTDAAPINQAGTGAQAGAAASTGDNAVVKDATIKIDTAKKA